MKINNLNLIWVVLAGIVFSITACKSPETNNISEMNILHLVVEDWSADAVGCYGNDIVQTPHTDALAAKGVMFNRDYCQATVCNPSRASFTTGIRPDKIKVYGNDDVMDIHVPERVEFMPAILKTNGAYTAQLGKLIHHWRHARRWVNDFDRLEMTRPEGFEGVVKGFKTEINERDWMYVPDKELDNRLQDLYKEYEETVREGAPLGWPTSRPFQQLMAEQLGNSGYDEDEMKDGQLARCTAEILHEFATEKKQFFLSVGLYAPHTPLLAPKKYIDMYDPEQMPLSLAPREHDKDIPDIALRNGSNYDIFNGDYPEYSATPERQREAIASYYGCSSFIDAQIGLILEALKKEGLDKNTVIVLFSDHGFHLGEHGCWSKFTLFEQSTRVPLIVYVPGAEGNGKVCDEIVELVDVLPTLCDLWELPKSEQFESTSFAPLLENPDQPWKIAAFTTIPLGGLGRSVRTKQFRYSEYRESTALPGGEEEPFARELYNLENDPWEQINLINDERYRDEMKELAQLLKDGWKAGLPPGNKQSPRSIY